MNNFYKKRIFPISIFTIIVLFTIIAFEFFIIYEGLNGFKFVSKNLSVKNTKISNSEKLFIKDKIDDIPPIIDYENTQITNLNDEIIIDIVVEEPVG